MKSLGVAKKPATRSLGSDDYHLLVESVADYAIFMLDPEGRIATWNKGAERIKGYKANEIIGQHFSKFYPRVDVEAGKPNQELREAQESGRVEDEGWRIRKDGSRFWANVVITALRDDQGNLRGYAKVTRDLTERRKTEEQRRQSEERLRLLVEAVGDCALYVIDLEGRVTTWNVGAQRMKGYEREEIIGRHFSIFFMEEDIRTGKPPSELEIARTQGRFEEENWRLRKDGSRFWAGVTLTPLRNASGDHIGYAKVTRDLTARKQAEETERNLVREQTARAIAEESERRLRESEEAAQRAAKRAEDMARAKEEFLATVSHELRTPLTAILGWTSMLRTRPLDASLAKAIEVIHRNTKAQARIVDDILDISRIVSGKFRLDLRSTNIVDIAEQAIDVVRPSADAKRISLTLASSSPSQILVADPDRLQQVVWNLLSNAVKFTPPGGRVDVGIERQGSDVQLWVRDNGIGIDPDFLPRVFERFNQADSSTTRRSGGLGLGLAVVRHIVELHGGQVEAESRGHGQGSTLRVIVPVRVLRPAEPASEHRPVRSWQLPDETPITIAGVRVLVVDDDSNTREMLEEFLEQSGAVVELTDSAQSGLDALQRFRPDVLISDIGMPGADGYSFIRRVRALEAGGAPPAIALTAYASDEDRAKALAAGFTGHIAKPVNPFDLLASIAEVVKPGPAGRRATGD
jgi:PAS domain S-box-containing protein